LIYISRLQVTLIAFLLLAELVLSSKAQASFFNFPQLDATMTDSLFRAIGSTIAFRPIEPASSLGKVFGIQVGLGATAVDASSIASITGSSAFLPFADLQVGVSIPMGITFEFGLLPSLTLSGASFSRYGGALKWTATDTVFSALPFDMAVRVSYSSAAISGSQTLQGVNITANYSSGILGAQVLVSKNFFVLEPYLGLGLMNHSSSLSGAGSVSLFQTGTTAVSGSDMSAWIQAGLLLKLAVFGIGAEYDNVLGYSSYSGKFSFRF